jgi:hypothetical protein
MNVLKQALNIGLLTLALANFSCANIESGKVVEKKYIPKHEVCTPRRMYIKCIPVYLGDSCKTEPEHYAVTFGKKNNDKLKTREVYMEKELYDCLKTGDYFDMKNPSCDVRDSGRKPE